MPPRRLSIEAAARRDLKALQAYGDSGLARAYLLLARQLDQGMPARDTAASAREMRLAFMALHDLSPSQDEGDFTDELQAQREKRMRGLQ